MGRVNRTGVTKAMDYRVGTGEDNAEIFGDDLGWNVLYVHSVIARNWLGDIRSEVSQEADSVALVVIPGIEETRNRRYGAQVDDPDVTKNLEDTASINAGLLEGFPECGVLILGGVEHHDSGRIHSIRHCCLLGGRRAKFARVVILFARGLMADAVQFRPGRNIPNQVDLHDLLCQILQYFAWAEGRAAVLVPVEEEAAFELQPVRQVVPGAKQHLILRDAKRISFNELPVSP